jgi:hypothetical protein
VARGGSSREIENYLKEAECHIGVTSSPTRIHTTAQVLLKLG